MTRPLLSAIFRFFKARTSGNIRCDLARVSNAEKSKKSHSPSGCVENGPAAALRLGYSPQRDASSTRLAGGPF